MVAADVHHETSPEGPNGAAREGCLPPSPFESELLRRSVIGGNFVAKLPGGKMRLENLPPEYRAIYESHLTHGELIASIDAELGREADVQSRPKYSALYLAQTYREFLETIDMAVRSSGHTTAEMAEAVQSVLDSSNLSTEDAQRAIARYCDLATPVYRLLLEQGYKPADLDS
jgi:hypothetical protein